MKRIQFFVFALLCLLTVTSYSQNSTKIEICQKFLVWDSYLSYCICEDSLVIRKVPFMDSLDQKVVYIAAINDSLQSFLDSVDFCSHDFLDDEGGIGGIVSEILIYRNNKLDCKIHLANQSNLVLTSFYGIINRNISLKEYHLDEDNQI